MPRPSTPEQYDAIVIGAGQGGGPLASALARAGKRTAIIERDQVGGTCINYGCTPTKTMVASARVAYLARRASDYGVNMGRISINLEKVRQRKRDIVLSFRSGSERRLTSTTNLDLIRAEASFIAPKTLELALNDGGTRWLRADLIFINTGAAPAAPPLPGLDTVPYLDSTSIMELDTVPNHLIVLGGGYIALEFAQMFRRFGSRVTVIQHSARLLGREDNDVADALADILTQDGLNILINTSALHVAPYGPERIRVNLKPKGQRLRNLVGSHLLVAVGRAANSGRLNLPATGVETNEHGFITVNDKLETNVPGIYALGDCNGGPAFTHISYDDYRILTTNLLENGDASTKNRMVPYVLYTDPQLGRVGLSESQAREQGYNIKVAKMPMDYVARALEVDESRGFMKAVVDADTNRILGCAILGIEGGELMSMLQIAMMGNLPYTTLQNATFAHPTLAESLNNLFSNFQD